MTDVLKQANELVDDFRGNKTCSCEFCERASEILPELVAECERLQAAVKDAEEGLTIAYMIGSDAKEKAMRGKAAHELGIATSDHIRDTTKMMMMTAEQRAALEYAISSLEQCDSEPEDPVVVEILQSMLSQSRPAWEITEERKAAIRRAHDEYKILPKDFAVLREMLEEAK